MIFFQDEPRAGQRSVLNRIWAKTNTRPPMVQDQRYGNCYLFSSICPDMGCLVYHVCGNGNTEQMNLHIERSSVKFPHRVHTLIVLDNASWHKSKKLLVLDNVWLLRLPPYSPQLKSVENFFTTLRRMSLPTMSLKPTISSRRRCLMV